MREGSAVSSVLMQFIEFGWSIALVRMARFSGYLAMQLDLILYTLAYSSEKVAYK